MPHSNFKERSQAFNTGVGKCSCGKTFKRACLGGPRVMPQRDPMCIGKRNEDETSNAL